MAKSYILHLRDAFLDFFRGLDPFNYRDFVAYYEEAHAEALVEEHKIHQWLAYNALGYDLNIATLVARNSIVDEQTRTLEIVKAASGYFKKQSSS